MNLLPVSLEFGFASVALPGGGERQILLGFGADGSLWVEPHNLRIRPEEAEKLAKACGEVWMLRHSVTGQVLINGHAALKVIDHPDSRRHWQSFMEKALKDYKQQRQQRESAQNN